MTEVGGTEAPEGSAPAVATCPDTWTDEQVAEFRRLWDEHGAELMHHEVRWLPAGSAVTDLTPRGSIIIEWAPPRTGGRPMPGWDTKVYDTATGDEIGSSVLRIRLIDVDASKVLTADLTMLADADGNPAAKPHVRGGDVITGVFRFNVSEMRVAQPKADAPRPCGTDCDC